MHIYVELWKARPAWTALSAEERGAYMQKVGVAIGELAKAGIESLYWAVTDDDTPHDAGYRYLAVWKMPDAAAARHFEEVVESAGWHTWFEQLNARGSALSADQAIGHMLGG